VDYNDYVEKGANGKKMEVARGKMVLRLSLATFNGKSLSRSEGGELQTRSR